MTVLIPIVETWDGPNRLIYLKEGVSDYYPIEDLYHEYIHERRVNEDFRKYWPLLKAEGNIPKGAGAFTPRYVVLLEGTKIVPFDEVLRINQLGDIITDDPDVDPSLYDVSSLTVPKVIYIKPSEAETIQLNSAAIQYASFGDRVSMDVTSANSGTEYPVGNVQYPVNNFADTLLIANGEGFDSVEVRESCSLNTGDFSGFNIYGKSHVNTTLTITSPADVSDITLKQFRLEGVLDGGTEVTDCILGDVLYFNGHIHNSALGGRLTLGGSNESFINNCSRLESETLPVIDFDDGDNHLVLSNYTGMLQFENMTVPTVNAMCGINRGIVILDTATCTAGTVNLIGIGFLRDELGNNIPSGTWNGMTINNMLMSNESVANAVLDEVA